MNLPLKKGSRTRLTNDVNDPIEFIADGNPSYDAAVHAINADKEGKPITRRKVIGLKNEDDESQQYSLLSTPF